jgi:multiple antibiotic resistance protein
LTEITNAFLVVYAALFPIVNPLGSALTFLGLTRHYSKEARDGVSLRIAVNSFLLLLGSLLIGSDVLLFFGVTLPVVRVAGGIVVASISWQLLNRGGEVDQKAIGPVSDRQYLREAFYPLTMPFTVGPGSITVAITLGSDRPNGSASLAHIALFTGASVAGLLAIAVTVFFCYRFAENIEKLLGETGMNVLIRLLAFLLLGIGIEILWSGASELLATTR